MTEREKLLEALDKAKKKVFLDNASLEVVIGMLNKLKPKKSFFDVYLKVFNGDKTNALRAWRLDAVQGFESINWIYNRLRNEKPERGTSHEWNVSQSLMADYMPELKRKLKKFISDPTEENARNYDKALADIMPYYKRGVLAINGSEAKTHWLTVREQRLKEAGIYTEALEYGV